MKAFTFAATLLVSLSGYSMTRGQPVTPENFKHPSAVYLNSCSATKIGDHHFLFAGHCAQGYVTGYRFWTTSFKFLKSNGSGGLELVEKNVTPVAMYLPDAVTLNTFQFRSITEQNLQRYDIAVLEILDETPEVPIKVLGVPRQPQLGDKLSFTCFGTNELYDSFAWSATHYEPRTGVQMITGLTPTHLSIEANAYSSNQFLPVDSGCAIHNEQDEIISILSYGDQRNRDKVIVKSHHVLITPHLDWIQRVLDRNAVSFRPDRFWKTYSPTGEVIPEPPRPTRRGWFR